MDPDRRIGRLGGVRPPADLDPSWPPWRQDVVDDHGGPAGRTDVAVLLRALEVVAPQHDDVVLPAVGPPRGHHVRHPVGTDSGYACQLRAVGEVCELRVREHAHAPPRRYAARCRDGRARAIAAATWASRVPWYRAAARTLSPGLPIDEA